MPPYAAEAKGATLEFCDVLRMLVFDAHLAISAGVQKMNESVVQSQFVSAGRATAMISFERGALFAFAAALRLPIQPHVRTSPGFAAGFAVVAVPPRFLYCRIARAPTRMIDRIHVRIISQSAEDSLRLSVLLGSHYRLRGIISAQKRVRVHVAVRAD